MNPPTIITHPEWGAYCGEVQGISLWTRLSGVPDIPPILFRSPAEAREETAYWRGTIAKKIVLQTVQQLHAAELH